MPRNALGKGLEALIPGAATEIIDGSRASTKEIPVGRIAPNPFQPRSRFDEASLKELAESIKATGILQPVLLGAALMVAISWWPESGGFAPPSTPGSR
jgi:ParB family chromosome partitioning protein